MQVVADFPPNIKEIAEKFDVTPTAVYTYGDTIYAPGKGDLDLPLLEHETIHTQQQGDDPAGWWRRYLDDADFRLGQELEAYQKQYQVAKLVYKDRNKLSKFLHSVAIDLSGPMYGNVISYKAALAAIKK